MGRYTISILFCITLLTAQGALARSRTPTTSVISPDASLVAAQTGDRIRIWKRASGERIAEIKSPPMFRGALTRGALVAVTGQGITVWRGPRFAEPVRLKTPKTLSMGRALLSKNGQVAAALFPADGGVGDFDTVGIWNARTGAPMARLTLTRSRALGAALSDDGRLVAVFGDRSRKQALLQVHRLSGKGVRQLLDWSNAQDRTTYCASFSPNGKLLALCAGKRLLLFDVTTRKPIAAVSTDAIKSLFPPPLRGPAVQLPGAHQVAFSDDGSQLVTLHAFGVNGIARWSTSPLKPRAWLKRPTEGGTMRQVTWDPQGRPWLISSTYDPRVWVHAPKGDRFTTIRVLNPGP